MKFTIKHEIRGRIRIHNCQKTMSADQADELQYYLITKDFVTSVKIYDRTNDIVICYDASRSEILTALKEFYHGIITVPDNYQESQSRQLNQTYQEKLISKVLFHYGNKLLFPYPLRAGITVIKSLKYIYEGIHTLAQEDKVPVLDGTAIGYRSFEEISIPHPLSCFYSESEKFSKNGHIRNPSKKKNDLAKACP